MIIDAKFCCFVSPSPWPHCEETEKIAKAWVHLLQPRLVWTVRRTHKFDAELPLKYLLFLWKGRVFLNGWELAFSIYFMMFILKGIRFRFKTISWDRSTFECLSPRAKHQFCPHHTETPGKAGLVPSFKSQLSKQAKRSKKECLNLRWISTVSNKS